MEKEVSNPIKVLRFAKRNFVSIVFPTVAIWAIYADYARTQRYKAKKAAEHLAVENSPKELL
jgi:hypothetical protein